MAICHTIKKSALARIEWPIFHLECVVEISLDKSTTMQLNALAWLIKHTQQEVMRIFGHSIPFTRERIVGHDQITPVTRPNCPGRAFPWDKLIARLNPLPEPNYTVPAPPTPPVGEVVRFDLLGQILDFDGIFRNDRNFVMVRPLLEALGFDVGWDNTTRTVIVRRP